MTGSKRNFFIMQEHREFSVEQREAKQNVDMSTESLSTDATAKHFDLRLQLDDELLSWAIPRRFKFDKEEYRLAVETTPHYFSEAIREGKVMTRTCAALWAVGSYEVRQVGKCASKVSYQNFRDGGELGERSAS